jgi:ribose 5-phosphate isomerase B
MKISIGSDHAGVELKQQIIQAFTTKYEFINVGANTVDSVDYPDFAHKAVSFYKKEKCEKIILICGSGNGIQMSANKHKDIRCALCWSAEIAELARLHNNANALALPARFINEKEAIKIVEVFLKTPFEGGRHKKRTDKINA